jgi:hypothetical protein
MVGSAQTLAAAPSSAPRALQADARVTKALHLSGQSL